MNALLVLYGVLCASAGSVIAAFPLFHYFQLESYQFRGYFKTFRRNIIRCVLPGVCECLLSLGVTFIVFSLPAPRVGMLLFALLIPGSLFIRKVFSFRKAKKPMVYTPRMKRLHGAAFAVDAAVMLAAIAVIHSRHSVSWSVPVYFVYMLAVSIVPLFLPLLTALSGIAAVPVEKCISEMYFRSAQHILASRPDLIKIGITGSYGKTSVKFILGTLLEEKFQVLVTPSSFNTPMGVTKTIRTKLEPSHQVFVAEMGARHVGDIKELCRLVHPTYGALTSVGPQHLDTFRTVDRIASTKYELMDAIPENGCCFFPDDSGICRRLYDKTEKPKRIVSTNGTDADVWCKDLSVSEEGSSFTLCTNGGEIRCCTRLLGEHNIQNILLCSAVCLELGMNLRQISRGISRLEPVEHRLQLIPSPGGVTTIDDAFNSNPNGALCAMKVLKQFPGRKIVVTPGMVELGEKESDFNRDLGREMAESANVAILVGRKHTSPIRQGLVDAGFPESDIHTVSSLDEASGLLKSMCREGDVILFENDLPDNYTE